jgi:phytoene dehydrogenase-like protein
MDRRAFLAAVAGGWMVHSVAPRRGALEGRIVGAAQHAGHLLRDAAALPAPEPAGAADVVIVGGGVSGLSAAWRLASTGLDVRVLELEPILGGTSASGRDGAVPHPWGAHYLAAPNPEARAALRLLDQMGVLTGWDAAGRPRFDPRVLCHAPEERLFYQGEWHTGLAPDDVLEPAARAELARFHELEHAWTERLGSDGASAFQIPVALSSRDPEILALDRISIATWLDQQRFVTPFVRWYVRYAMLDDYGAEPEDVSAWAGLHYFAARKLRTPELEGSHFLVWPEGNGRLVDELAQRSGARTVQGALVTAIAPHAAGATVSWLDVANRRAHRIDARAVILAVPAFVARRLLPTAAARLPARASSPWLVANLHVERPFDPDLAWDSVLYQAEGLGYVDAGHQRTLPSDRTVLTYYRAWGSSDVAASRAQLAGANWADLAEGVLGDLAPAHPHLREELERMDIMLWGHGMPRPRPGFLGSELFRPPVLLDARVAWAHVDQSGMALFEEGQARGVTAAETLSDTLGVDLGETWL